MLIGKKSLVFIHSLFLICAIIACNSPYRQMIDRLSGKQFCLDSAFSEEDNQIVTGKGTLTLNPDQTFTILVDSLKPSRFTGSWDLCCKGSDYGNYVFRVNGLADWQQNNPNLFIKVENKKIRLFFGRCQ